MTDYIRSTGQAACCCKLPCCEFGPIPTSWCVAMSGISGEPSQDNGSYQNKSCCDNWFSTYFILTNSSNNQCTWYGAGPTCNTTYGDARPTLTLVAPGIFPNPYPFNWALYIAFPSPIVGELAYISTEPYTDCTKPLVLSRTAGDPAHGGIGVPVIGVCSGFPDTITLYPSTSMCSSNGSDCTWQPFMGGCYGVQLPCNATLTVSNAGGCNGVYSMIVGYSVSRGWCIQSSLGSCAASDELGDPILSIDYQEGFGFCSRLYETNFAYTEDYTCSPLSITLTGVDLSRCCPGATAATLVLTGIDGPGHGGCCNWTCATPGVSVNLVATVTNKMGCYTVMPDIVNFICSDLPFPSTPHQWVPTTVFAACGFANTYSSITCGALGIPLLILYPPIFGGETQQFYARPGFTCSLFSAVFDVMDNMGNSCTITVVG